MGKARIRNKKPADEHKHLNKQIAELKRENHSLKRKVSKLQKYVQRLLESGERSTNEESPEVEVKKSSNCPECGCGKAIVTVKLPVGSLRACKNCGWRRFV